MAEQVAQNLRQTSGRLGRCLYALEKRTMSDAAIYSATALVAIAMLALSFRSLSWHTVSPVFNLLLAVGVIYTTWQLVTKSSRFTFEHDLLFILCVLVGLLVGFVRGQAMPIRYHPTLHDVVCKRGGLLIFSWAAVALAITTMHNAPNGADSSWLLWLSAALVFLTASFLISTLTLFARARGAREEHELLAPHQSPST
jgi:uncharacterized sodium:solute symporter family permease YidK